jgi:arylsulfatase A-like enzyme
MRLTTLIPLAAITISGTKTTEAQTPNIVIFNTDDMGWSDLGSYGAVDYETPNIDSLALHGIRFTSFYAASAVSSPSRASLLTASYPLRVGLPEVLAPEGPEWAEGRNKMGLNQNEITIPELLKPLGYATACIGKWHLGHHEEFLPLNHGFDMFFGLPYSNDMRPETSPVYPDLPLINGNKTIELNPDQRDLTVRFTEQAINFISQSIENAEPFFLYFAHTMPHTPLYVSEKFKGSTENGMYGDVITEVDWSVGEMVKILKDNGQLNNTLIIFTSDNGPWQVFGNHAGLCDPFRGDKGTTFEGGHRVPAIMHWPGVIPAGQVSDEIVTNMDILPTICRLNGIQLPENKIDGKCISEILKGEPGAKSPHDAFYYYNGSNLEAVRSGKWKIHFAHNYRSVLKPGFNGDIGSYHFPKQEEALYNLETNPGENINLKEEYIEVFERLKKMGEIFDADLKQNTRPPGHI